jgi:hypothetical protein
VDPLAGGGEDVDIPQPAKGGKKGKKTAFEMLEEFEAGNDEDDAPGGGLMVSTASRPRESSLVSNLHSLIGRDRLEQRAKEEN